MAAPYSNEKRSVAPTLTGESEQAEGRTPPPAPAAPEDDRHVPEADDGYQIELYDDYVVVHGILPPDVCEGLLEQYFEAGRGPCGRTVWWRCEVHDA